MDEPDKFVCVLLGYNPIELARTVPVEGWGKSFMDVVKRMQQRMEGQPRGRCHILNPIVGPEALTGSTRMKGGSATKIMLEIIFSLAASDAVLEQRGARAVSANAVAEQLMEYEQAIRYTYLSADSIASVIGVAGNALRRSGHVYYMGFSAFGIAGLVDASECPPTYSGTRDDVRAFLHGGYTTLQNSQGDLGPLGQEMLLKWADFDRVASPTLGPNDVLIFLLGTVRPTARDAADIQQRVDAAKSRQCKVACVTMHEGASASSDVASFGWDAHVSVRLGRGTCLSNMANHIPETATGELQFLAELSMKLVVNAITTGGHILKGKVRLRVRFCV